MSKPKRAKRFLRSCLQAFGLAVWLYSAGGAQPVEPSPNPLDPRLQVKVQKLQLEGNEALPDEEFKDILEGYQDRLLSFEDIRRIADAIVTRYREHDYLTVSAYLPEQNLSDGTVRIRVVESKIGDIAVEGAKHYSPEFVRWMFEPALDRQKRGELPRRSDVQRQLLLLNDNMDLSVRSVLRESNKEGTVDMILQVQDENPVHFSIDYNNLGARTTGEHRLGAGFEWGDLSGRGDLLNLRYVESGLLNADTKGLDLFMVGYSAPLNNNGTYLDFSYANSAFVAGQELQILDIRGDADVLRAGIRHKLIRSPEGNLDIAGGVHVPRY